MSSNSLVEAVYFFNNLEPLESLKVHLELFPKLVAAMVVLY